MKKTIFIVILIVFTFGGTVGFANKADLKRTLPITTERNLTKSEADRFINRVEAIRNMDKSNMTVKEKHELRNELKDMKENVRKNGGAIYIGSGTLLLVIILIIILL